MLVLSAPIRTETAPLNGNPLEGDLPPSPSNVEVLSQWSK